MRRWCLIAAMGCATLIGIDPANAQYYRWGYGPPMRPYSYVYPYGYGWRYGYEPPPYDPEPEPYVRRPIFAVPSHGRLIGRPAKRHRTAIHHLRPRVVRRSLVNPLLGPLPDQPKR